MTIISGITMRPQEDPVVREVVQTLREWHAIWKTLYLEGQNEPIERISLAIIDLFDLRRQLLQTNLNNDQLRELKYRIVNKIDAGNRILNLDLVPRIDSQAIKPRDLCPIKLYQLHCEASGDSSKPYTKLSCADSSISSSSNGSNSIILHATHNLHFSIKDFNLNILSQEDYTEIYASIIDATTNGQIKFMSEKHLVKFKKDIPTSPLDTIFTDFSNTDIGRDLYLFIQVYRVGRMNLTDGVKALARHQSSTGTISTNNTFTSNSNSNGSTQSMNSAGKTNNFSNNFDYKGLSENQYKRPFGGAVVPITEIVRGNHQESDYPVRISACNEADFHQLHETLLKKQVTKLNQTAPSIHLNLALRFFKGDHNLFIKDECITRKRGFPDVVMPGDFRNDLHFVLEGGEFEKGGKSIPKNIEACISLIDSKGIPIEKCLSHGSGVDNVTTYKSGVFYHCNSPKWNEAIKFVLPLEEFDGAHVRIEFRHCSTKDLEKRFLGFCYMPLSDTDGTVISNKQHELYLYRYDLQSFEDESFNILSYTLLPYGPGSKNLKSNGQSNLLQSNSSANRFYKSSKEIIYVNTFLLSTKLTQNSDLLTLLKWRELNPDDIEGSLKKVLYMDGEEIVKFLQDILDTLFDTFSIFSTSNGDPKKNCSGLIFKVLVHIFSLLDEPKYAHFKPVLDTYVAAHFAATLVYRGLLSCVKQCADYSSDVDKHGPIQRCFKSLHYVFQFIVQSRLLYIRATGEHNDEAFTNDLRLLFSSFNRMLSDNDNNLIPIQVVFLSAFPSTFDQILRVIPPMELTGVVTNFTDIMSKSSPQTILRAKLKFMHDTLESDLCKNLESRQRIIETFAKELDHLVSTSKELELCAEILSTLLTKIYDFHWPKFSDTLLHDNNLRENSRRYNINDLMTISEIKNIMPTSNSVVRSASLHTKYPNHLPQMILTLTNELSPIVLNLLDSVIYLLEELLKDGHSDKNIIQHYYSCLLTILKLMSEQNYNSFLHKIKGQQKEFLLSLYSIIRNLKDVYNRDWLVMQMVADSIIEHSLEELSKPLTLEFSSYQFDKNLWAAYFNLTVEFLTHPNLQLEMFSDSKKNYILQTFGDLRLKMGKQMLEMWNELGPFKVSLIPTMITSFLEVTLVPIDELQRETLPVFYDMIDSEYKARNDFRQVERCLIDSLEILIMIGKGDELFIERFNSILVKNIESKSPIWKEQGLRFASSVSRQMHLLLDLRNIPDGSENKNKRMNCIVNLLYFYKKEYKRYDMYVKYIYKLCDIHLPANNYVEAAFTLKLYADSLEWSHKNLSSLDGHHPEEEEWKRKELLYTKIIDYFDQGKCWEEAVNLCKELAFFYETCLVDYSRLSNVLRKLASFLDSILTRLRPDREYFRVGFYGTDFPAFIKDKEYIFRGGEYERLATFMQRILNEYPDATILSSTSKQQVNSETTGQNIVISNVKPIPCLEAHLKPEEKNISEKIIGYYLNNRLNTFFYDKPIQKGVGDKENEFRTLWVERTTLKSYEPLPGILPWFEICERTVTEISPINHAIETISNMNVEMSKLISKYRDERMTQISPLTMRLQGVIEAAVNGGIAVIIDAFLSPKYIQINPNCSELVPKLKNLIKHQFRILESGLVVHEKLAPPEVQPLHARLVERLNSIKSTLIDIPSQSSPRISLACSDNESGTISRSCSILNQPLPPMPISKKSTAPIEDDDYYNSDSNYDDQIYSLPSDPPVKPSHEIDKREDRLSSLKTSECTSSLSSIAILSNFPQNRPKNNFTSVRTNALINEVAAPKKPHLDVHSSLSELVNQRLAQNAQNQVHSKSRLSCDSTNSHLSLGQCSLNKDVSFSLWSNPSSNTNSLVMEDAPPLPPRTLDRVARQEIIAQKDKILTANCRPSKPVADIQRIQIEATKVSDISDLDYNTKMEENGEKQLLVSVVPPPLPHRLTKVGLESEINSVTSLSHTNDLTCAQNNEKSLEDTSNFLNILIENDLDM